MVLPDRHLLLLVEHGFLMQTFNESVSCRIVSGLDGCSRLSFVPAGDALMTIYALHKLSASTFPSLTYRLHFTSTVRLGLLLLDLFFCLCQLCGSGSSQALVVGGPFH